MYKFTLSLALTCSVFLHGQVMPLFQHSYEFTVAANYHNDMFHDVKASPDGGLVLLGHYRNSVVINGSNIVYMGVKMDSVGNVLWTAPPLNFRTAAVAPTSDNGMVLYGQSTDSVGTTALYLARYSATGNLLWTQQYHAQFLYSNAARGVEQTPDGGFLLSTTLRRNDSIYQSAFFKTDSAGNVGWQQAAQYDPIYGNLSVCARVHPQGYLLGSTSGLLSLVDGSGDPIWLRQYVDSIGAPSFSRMVVDASGAMFGYGNWANRLMRISADGNTTWERQYDAPGLGSFSINGFVGVKDGYLVYGNSYDTTMFQSAFHSPVLFKIDTTGQVVWGRRYGDPGWRSVCNGIASLKDSSIALCGYVQYPPNMVVQGWVCRTDATGDALCLDQTAIITASAPWSLSYFPAMQDTFSMTQNSFVTTQQVPASNLIVRCSTVGIDEPPVSDSPHIRYAPGELFIDLPEHTGAVKVQVYSLTGALIKSWSTFDATTRLSFGNMTDGIYLLDMSNGKQRWNAKIVVQR